MNKFGDINPKVLDAYTIHEKIIKGANGVIYRATAKSNSEPVVIKRICEGLSQPNQAEMLYRQLRLLKHFKRHPNIVKVLNVMKCNAEVYLFFEEMEANLQDTIRADILSLPHIRCIAYQMLCALKHIHSAEIIHRDINPRHILINSECKIKLIDFGLAKSTDIFDEYKESITDYDSIRWYRAPEMLMGTTPYTKAVDVWSVGCVLAEMLAKRVFLSGTSTLDQLSRIFQFTGEKDKFGLSQNIKQLPVKRIEEFFAEGTDKDAIDLVVKMMRFDPEHRITVEAALDHPFVKEFRRIEDELTTTKFDFMLSKETIKEIEKYKAMNNNQYK